MKHWQIIWMCLLGISGPEAVQRCWAGLRKPAVSLHFTILTQHHPRASRHCHGHCCFQCEERNKLLCIHKFNSKLVFVVIKSILLLVSRWHQPSRMAVCTRPSLLALLFSLVAIWVPTWLRLEGRVATVGTVHCFNTWYSWSRARRRAPWWQVGVSVISISGSSFDEANERKSCKYSSDSRFQTGGNCLSSAQCVLALTEASSFAQTNELLLYGSTDYESMTWVHCAPLHISLFTE